MGLNGVPETVRMDDCYLSLGHLIELFVTFEAWPPPWLGLMYENVEAPMTVEWGAAMLLHHAWLF